MTAKCFVDTNVLLYAGSKAPEYGPKRVAARALRARPDVGFSAQVLQEFYAVAVAKQRLQMTPDEAVAVMRSPATFPVVPITRELVLEAIDIRQRFGIFLLGRGNRGGGQADGLPISLQRRLERRSGI